MNHKSLEIVDRIKELCKNKNISIKKLEKKLSFGNGSIYNWDKNSPSIGKILKVANYFSVSIDYKEGAGWLGEL